MKAEQLVRSTHSSDPCSITENGVIRDYHFFVLDTQIFNYSPQKLTLRAGFEPARAMPIGFQVQRLNHSAITAAYANVKRQRMVAFNNLFYSYI